MKDWLYSDTVAAMRPLMPRTATRWTFYVAFWTAISAIAVVHYQYFSIITYPYTWGQVIWGKLWNWYAWGLLTPVILAASQRYRLNRKPRLTNILRLFVICTAVTFVYLLHYTLVILVIQSRPLLMNVFIEMFRFVIIAHSVYFVFLSCVTVGIEHAVGYYRNYHESQIRETQLQLKASQLESQLARAQLAALQGQLHPHFLFNTLNAISSFVTNDEKQEASNVIAELSELLRLSLVHSQAAAVPLEKEIDFVERYLDLVAVRFADRISTRIHVEPEALSVLVPSLIIQPLVENAVKHGVSAMEEPGTLEVEVSVRDNRLKIAVTNDCPSENVEEVRTDSGIGLQNLRERLRHIYGDDYFLSLDISHNGRVRAEVSLPTKHDAIQLTTNDYVTTKNNRRDR